jgi:hypothetical protein
MTRRCNNSIRSSIPAAIVAGNPLAPNPLADQSFLPLDPTKASAQLRPQRRFGTKDVCPSRFGVHMLYACAGAAAVSEATCVILCTRNHHPHPIPSPFFFLHVVTLESPLAPPLSLSFRCRRRRTALSRSLWSSLMCRRIYVHRISITSCRALPCGKDRSRNESQGSSCEFRRRSRCERGRGCVC